MKELNLGIDAVVSNGDTRPPWEDEDKGSETVVSDPVITEEKKDLEIYKKAERFNSLHLLSGNNLPDGITAEQYIKDNYGTEGIQRYKLAKYILQSLGYVTSDDVLLMLSCTKHAKVVIATAGAGKTTSLQFDLLVSKLIDKVTGTNVLKPGTIEGTSVLVPKILYLNYNKHNVQPIAQRHVALCSAVNKLFKDEEAVDDLIDSSTVHAFCLRWLKSFSGEVDIPELEIISDDDKKNVWESIIKPRWKKFYPNEDARFEYTLLDELYVYKTESMLDWDEFFQTAKFVDSELGADFVMACIKKYDSMKKQMGLIDFTDYIVLLINILKEHPELKQRLQEHYRIIIADENQDFTRLMNELLLQLYNPAENRLVVVGDPDQTIYAFKGVSPDNVVTLMENLEDAQLLGLDTNYRCPDEIVDAAKVILDKNILRFKKPIETVKTGGKIFLHPMQPGEQQESDIIRLIKSYGREHYKDTVITYRNNNSSLIIGEELYYAGIPFKILDDRRPFNNMVFRQITNALKALKQKDNIELNKTLYRFLPMSKEFWWDILEHNRTHRRNHIFDLDVPSNMPNGSDDAFRTLFDIANNMDTLPTSDYIDSLVRLYKLYYFNFITQQGGPMMPGVDNFPRLLERTLIFYRRPMSFDYMMQELVERNVDNEAGVTLSTFHGLKGLEFENVIAIDFNETIFPNYYGIEQRYPENTALEEKESENRLCYVLVTRAINEFHMYYDNMDRSVYVPMIAHKQFESDVGKPEEPSLTLNNVSGATSNNSQLDFIQRLIGDRK